MLCKEQLILLFLIIIALIICFASPPTNIDTFSDLVPETIIDGYSDHTNSGYRRQILRPFDSVSQSFEGCSYPCNSKDKFQQWDSQKNAEKYHAMRPLMHYEKYEQNIRSKFNSIIDKFHGIVIPNNSEFSKVDFNKCSENRDIILDMISTKINNNTDEYYIISDPDMYEYIIDDSIFYKFIFNIVNINRSIATLCYVTVVFINRNAPLIIDADIVHKEKYNGFTEEFSDSKEIIIPDQKDQSLSWNFMNTVQEQNFNMDLNKHIIIEGGIPDSLRKIIRENNCNNNLTGCDIPTLNVDGTVTDKEHFYGSVETISGTILV